MKTRKLVNNLFIIIVLFSVIAISCSKDNELEVSNEDVYDLDWKAIPDTNVVVLDFNGEHILSDNVDLSFGIDYHLIAKNINEGIDFRLYSDRKTTLTLDTFKIWAVDYKDNDINVLENSSRKGYLAIKKYQIIETQNNNSPIVINDSILIEGVFHIKLNWENPNKDLKGLFRYYGPMRNFVLTCISCN